MNTLEIVPDLYQVTIRYANIFLIVEKSLTLIDTGYSGSAPHITEFIQQLGRKADEINLIILTHNHLDHTGGLVELKKIATHARIAAHKADVEIPESAIPYPVGNIAGVLLRTPGLSTLRRKFVLGPESVDRILEGGETFDVLGGLQVISTPGHTMGSISLYAPIYKVLIV